MDGWLLVDRTHFIDKGVSPTGVPNFLFRGDEPKINGASVPGGSFCVELAGWAVSDRGWSGRGLCCCVRWGCVNAADTFAFDAILRDMARLCQSEGNCQLPSTVYFVDVKYARSSGRVRHFCVCLCAAACDVLVAMEV